jgi:hypothetical protein
MLLIGVIDVSLGIELEDGCYNKNSQTNLLVYEF